MNRQNVLTSVLAGERLCDNYPSSSGGQVKAQLPGSCRGQRASIALTESTLSRHLMLIGGTGSGKSNTIYTLIKQLKHGMTTDDVMIIFDTKGDYYKHFATNQDLVIGNSKDFRGISQKWNIYREILSDGADWQDIESNAHEIALGMFADTIEKNSSNPFFPMAAQDVFATLLLRYIREGLNDASKRNLRWNNRSLKMILDTLTIEVLNILFMEPEFQSVLNYVGATDNPQGLVVIAEMQNITRQIFRGAFAEDGRFSMRNFVRQKGGRTLFIEYDLSLGAISTPIYRLLVDLALKEALSRQKASGNVYLICDEFKLLPLLQHIEDAVNFGRGLGVKVIAGLQSIQQLTQVYGEERGRNILAGFSSIFAFKPNDFDTCKYISDLYGSNYLYDQFRGTGTSVVGQERTGKTVEDWEIRQLHTGEAIVGVDLQSPYVFSFDLFRG